MLLTTLIVFCSIAVFTIVFDYYLRSRNTCEFLKKIPVVSKIPIFGSLIVLSRFQPDNLHEKFAEFVGRFGKSFHARIFGTLVVVTADPRYIDELLTSQKHLNKHLLYLLLSTWLGNGLLLSYGQNWKKMRKIITPTFHFKILEEFVVIFDRQSSILIEKLQQFANGATTLDIYPHIGLLTLDIIAETAMGVSVNAQTNSKSDFVHAVNDVTNILATRFVRPHLAYPFLFRLMAPELYRKQKEGIKIMHDFTERIIEERRVRLKVNKTTTNATQTDTEDIGIKRRQALLDVLLQSEIDGQPLTDKQIRDEVNTFMFEGHDTTTSATSFALYLLSRHAECQEKLFEEIREHFGDDLKRSITYRDLNDLNYLNCVIKEALRLFPPVPAIGRLLKEDLKLVDITIPSGTNVIVLLWMLLRDAELFPQPERYWPERHLEASSKNTSAFTNIPFSAGPRNCIGQRFALYEMKMIIVKMLRHFQLLPFGAEVQPSIKIVLRSKNGINFGIKARTY